MGLFVRTIGIARATSEDRHGQSRLQSHPLRLAPGANCARMTAKAAQHAAATSVRQSAAISPIKSEAITAHQAVTNFLAVPPVWKFP